MYAKPRAPHAPARAALAAALALAVGTTACAGGSGGASEGDRSTFHRASAPSLDFAQPVATVSDLVPPTAPKAPWTIVGSLFDPHAGAPVAAVWTAADAQHWRRATIHPARHGVGESLAAAAPVTGGLLAVGRVGDGDASDAALWRQDGDRWRLSRPPAMGGPHEQWAFDVAAGKGGILVAGGESVWGEVRPRLWFSADGTTWKTVDGGPGGPFDATGDESVRDIAAVGNGFVAVGSRDVDNEQDGVAWYSPDGRSWQEVKAPALGGRGRQELLAVAATGRGVVAGGYADTIYGSLTPATPAVWTSPDGRTWQRVAQQLPLVGGPRNAADDLTIRSLSVDRGGILAAGGDDWRPQAWRSTDGGTTWTALPNPVHGGQFQDGVRFDDAAAANGITVALGDTPAVLVLGTRWNDATGTTFPKGGAQPFATSVAERGDVTVAAGGHFSAGTGTARDQYSGYVWRRDGGGRWTPVASKQLAPGQVMDVVPTKGGFAAVGIEDFGLAAKRKSITDDLPDGIVWVSPDGRTWRRVGAQKPQINSDDLIFLNNPTPADAQIIAEMEAKAPEVTVAPAGGPGTRSLSAAAPIGGGFIAVGTAYDNGDADPIVVISPDGKRLQGENPGIGGPGNQRLNDVCVAPDRTAVAVGVSGLAGSYDAVLSRRDPAGRWKTAAPADKSFSGPGDQFAYACAASEDGFVVVGSDDRSGDTDARVWTSTDGLHWTQVMAGSLGGTGDQWASAVAAAPGGGWLVGGTDTAHGDGDIALWRITRDGDVVRRDRGEKALGGPGEQSVTSISVDPQRHVTLAGTDYGRAGIWESTVLDR